MKALHKLQQAFAADLWGDELRHLEGVILDDHLPASRRFNVYRNNFRLSLTDALAAIYPVVEQLVGHGFFAFTADSYLRTHPSRSGTVHNFGVALADFLSNFEPASTLPYLPDIARLEWAYHEVFHAAAPEPFKPELLENVAFDHYSKLHFGLGSACRLIHSISPIFRIWQVNQDGYTGDQQVNLDVGAESVLVVRPKLEVELRRLNVEESAFLKALDAGQNLGEAVNTSLIITPDFDLASALARHLSSGALIVLYD